MEGETMGSTAFGNWDVGSSGDTPHSRRRSGVRHEPLRILPQSEIGSAKKPKARTDEVVKCSHPGCDIRLNGYNAVHGNMCHRHTEEHRLDEF